jgi:hypothetical protein
LESALGGQSRKMMRNNGLAAGYPPVAGPAPVLSGEQERILLEHLPIGPAGFTSGFRNTSTSKTWSRPA